MLFYIYECTDEMIIILLYSCDECYSELNPNSFSWDRCASSGWSPCRGQRFPVTFTFVPGHADARANERVAGLTTTDNGQPMDRADFVDTLRKLRRAEDFERGDSKPLSRMYGIEREEWHGKD